MSDRLDFIDWSRFAACNDADPGLFFASDGETEEAATIREASALLNCAVCPVRIECLEFALGTGTKHGVFGGTTETERASVRRSMLRRANEARKTELEKAS